jgi:predicted GTPase
VLNLIRSQNNRYHRVIALIDGEHYPQVTSDAISVLKENFGKRFAGIIFMGGTEKISAKKSMNILMRNCLLYKILKQTL